MRISDWSSDVCSSDLILDTALIRVSPEAYDAVIGTYKNPVMGIGEVALVGAIAYHAFNGLRIILVDFWGWATRHQRQLWRSEEHTSELQSLMRISYAVFCLK